MSRPKTEYLMLPCALTDDEVAQKSDAMADAVDRYRRIEAEKKELVAEKNDELKKARAQYERLGEEVKTKTEDRNVKCRWVKNQAAGRMELMRTDTGELVEHLPLSGDDMQERLPGVDDMPDGWGGEPLSGDDMQERLPGVDDMPDGWGGE